MCVCVCVCAGGVNESLCAIESLLQLKRFPPQGCFEPSTANSSGRCLTYWAIGALESKFSYDNGRSAVVYSYAFIEEKTQQFTI